MKKLFFLLFIFPLGTITIEGQFAGIGGGLTYGTGFHYNNVTYGFDSDLYKSPLIAIYVKGIFKTQTPFQIVPALKFFIPRSNSIPDIGTTTKSTKVNEIMIDANGQYIFGSLKWSEIYGLSGINVTLTTLKWSDESFSPGMDNALGLNLGAGISMKIYEKMDFSSEIKYILGKYHQLVIDAGIIFYPDLSGKKGNQ
jgi:hypothetical protein